MSNESKNQSSYGGVQKQNRDLLDFYPPVSGRSDLSMVSANKENRLYTGNSLSNSKANIMDYQNSNYVQH